MEGFDAQELATLLDGEYGVQVRSGLHCAPRMHRRLGTLEQGGTVRFSLGTQTELADIEAAISAMSDLAANVMS